MRYRAIRPGDDEWVFHLGRKGRCIDACGIRSSIGVRSEIRGGAVPGFALLRSAERCPALRLTVVSFHGRLVKYIFLVLCMGNNIIEKNRE